MISLNPVEFAVGFCIQLPFYYLIGGWMFPLAFLSGLLWSLGGAKNSNKLFRRIGVPFSSCVALTIVGDHLLSSWLAFIPGCTCLWLGYGEKSWMWCVYLNITQKRSAADYLTRMTTYVLFWLAFGLSTLVRF